MFHRGPGGLDLSEFEAVILAASVHLHKHESEMIAFVKAHKAALLDMPTVFLSVSLSQAAVENRENATAHRARAHAEVEEMIESFFAATDFRPSSYKAVAGALVYNEYSWLVRLIMKRIAKAEGASTDTTRNYEYTDWTKLDELVAALASGTSPNPRDIALRDAIPSPLRAGRHGRQSTHDDSTQPRMRWLG